MSHGRAWATIGRRLAVAGTALTLTVGGAEAEYRIGAGDIIEVSVPRLPELHIRDAVQMDGTLELGEAGEVRIASLSRKDARHAIQQAMAAAAFRRNGAGGRDGIVTVEAEEVSVAVVEYRPVFLSGDVVRPGEQPFRVGRTLRQALAIAGGLGFPKTGVDPRLAADLQSDYRTLALEYAVERARAWRLSAELGATETLDAAEFKGLPISNTALTRILSIENHSLKAWRDEGQRQKDVVDQSVSQIGSTIAIVAKQKDDEEKGTAADAEELHALLDLRSHGDVTSTRVNEARRAVLLASTRNLQTQAELLRLKLEKDDINERIARLGEQRRLIALAEIEVVNASLETTQVKLAAARDKAKLMGLKLREDPGSGRQTTFVLYRKTPAGENRAIIDERTELEPGDVVEVTVTDQDSMAER